MDDQVCEAGAVWVQASKGQGRGDSRTGTWYAALSAS